ncbi:hypothetical protein PHISCL_01008 [Aspergillus sclerotialis]|uniref:Uncharacterized protein n=1 Tax=Aspergillus sclerotialis TaxID=2070753 RepID=A0A3A3A4N8_9EURO|nr:hypothetical protein PHISCL_01008 [Aspergillus sclerotialis]
MAQEADHSHPMTESLPDAVPAAPPTKQSYRSFKKKYAKLKVKFALRMKESETLIREDLHIEDLSKRIREQNDQLLEVLMEFNDSIHVPSNLRYDLSDPSDSFLPYFEKDVLPPAYNNAASAKFALENAKADMIHNRITPEAYRNLENAVKRGRYFAPGMRYTSLSNVPHTRPRSGEDGRSGNSELEQQSKLGFLTPESETEYYLAMDARLGDETAALQLSRAPEKPSFADRERDASLRSSVSVYNWLRKNQPHIFLQDNENASEKSASRPSNVRSSKRVSTQNRKDDDTYDEDGSIKDAGASSGGSKGKRKRDEDTSYRPKGGSSRSSRKKKDDGTKRSTPKRPLGSGS